MIMGLKKLQVHEERRTDSCWSWVVCISSFVVYFFVYGQIYSFGSLFVALLEEFGRSEAETGKFFHEMKNYMCERLNRTFRICDINIFVLFLTENINLFCCCNIPCSSQAVGWRTAGFLFWDQVNFTPPLDISLWELCQNPIIFRTRKLQIASLTGQFISIYFPLLSLFCTTVIPYKPLYGTPLLGLASCCFSRTWIFFESCQFPCLLKVLRPRWFVGSWVWKSLCGRSTQHSTVKITIILQSK